MNLICAPPGYSPLLAAGNVTNGQLALIGVIAVVIVLMLISSARRRRESGPSPRAYAREQIARIKEERAVTGDLGDLMLQLQQLARETNAQLDTKFIRLERCIAEADERIHRLEGMLRRAGGKPTLDTTVGEDSPLDGSPESRPSAGSYRERIWALHGEGKSHLEIAQAVGKSVGEVQLIVALRKGRSGQKLSAQA